MLHIFNNNNNKKTQIDCDKIDNKIELWLFINIKVLIVVFSLKLPIWSPVINRNFKWLFATFFLTFKKMFQKRQYY